MIKIAQEDLYVIDIRQIALRFMFASGLDNLGKILLSKRNCSLIMPLVIAGTVLIVGGFLTVLREILNHLSEKPELLEYKI